MFHVHQGLIAVRRQHPWLVRARTSVVELSNERFTYESRPAAGAPEEGDPAAVIRVTLDVSGEPRVQVEASGATAFTWPAG